MCEDSGTLLSKWQVPAEYQLATDIFLSLVLEQPNYICTLLSPPFDSIRLDLIQFRIPTSYPNTRDGIS